MDTIDLMTVFELTHFFVIKDKIERRHKAIQSCFNTIKSINLDGIEKYRYLQDQAKRRAIDIDLDKALKTLAEAKEISDEQMTLLKEIISLFDGINHISAKIASYATVKPVTNEKAMELTDIVLGYACTIRTINKTINDFVARVLDLEESMAKLPIKRIATQLEQLIKECLAEQD